MRVLSRCIAVTVTAALGVGCDEPISPDDYIFTEAVDLWCGSSLCDWKVVRGAVLRSSTWHHSDMGVSLGPDTAIEQLTLSSFPVTPSCFRFDLVASVAEEGAVQIKVDVFADGTVEQTLDVPRGRWVPVTLRFRVEPNAVFRIEIATNGLDGANIVARMRTDLWFDTCEDLVPLDGGPAPLGAACTRDAECASSLCTEYIAERGWCSACDPDNPSCPEGQICGQGAPDLRQVHIPYSCVVPGARMLAERCVTDAECASGMCVNRFCSACRTAEDCGGVDCTPAYQYGYGPQLCGPGRQLGQAGAPCVSELDCASRGCRGLVRRECEDGRACVFDTDCPRDFPRARGECETVGIQGGVCD